ncbi:MAG: DUF2141 domain-containing protein [Cytophagales bacterium]|nr:MAG: DUF2141 domain-containing protein [Cytophagales bacterium]
MNLMTLLWAVFAPVTSPSHDPQNATLTITVQNVRTKTGSVRIALMKDCGKFPDCKPVQTAIMDASNGSFQKSFTLEPGDYAVAVFHDINANDKLDTKLFGIPKEPYGFSNNFRPRLSAPKFSDCRISVGAGTKAISIRVE